MNLIVLCFHLHFGCFHFTPLLLGEAMEQLQWRRLQLQRGDVAAAPSPGVAWSGSASLGTVHRRGTVFCSGSASLRKAERTCYTYRNKMKPTNPNADTYVEKQGFNTYLSQFPANPLVEHPDLTHWSDNLVGHPCLTLLRYALVRHSCLTLWFDTLVGHPCLTLLRYALVRHSCLTLWFDTLVGHSCLTLF